MVVSATVKLEDGNHIFYVDSGPVYGSDDYTTLVLCHGSLFNAHTFESIHEFAAKYNVRTIAVQRKQYPGSTPYTEAEIQNITNAKQAALDHETLLMAHLLKYFVETMKIPKVSADRKKGGFAILGWSMGTVLAMPIFSGVDILPPGLYSFLKPYVKNLVLLDPPYCSFGHDLPEGWMNTVPDPPFMTVEEYFTNIPKWMGYRWETPDDEDFKLDLVAVHKRKRIEKDTLADMPKEKLELYTSMAASIQSQEFSQFIGPFQVLLREMTRKIFFDENIISNTFPEATAIIVCADKSIWQCVWGIAKFKKLYQENVANGVKARPTTFVQHPEGNHFMHIEIPEETLSTICKGF